MQKRSILTFKANCRVVGGQEELVLEACLVCIFGAAESEQLSLCVGAESAPLCESFPNAET